jgi:glycosyltransferase involved in cell wall biosynthesis
MRGEDWNGALVVTIARQDGRPWWWRHLDVTALPCRLDHGAVVVPGGRPAGPLSAGFLPMVRRISSVLRRARRERFLYVMTFECDYSSFVIAALQTLTGARYPRHVILQFIMREQADTFASRLKYAFMRWCFSSVYRCICSSTQEANYYTRTFRWPSRKAAFVPFHTNPEFLERKTAAEEPFVIAAGRTFRDYPTLVEAFRGIAPRLLIVASPGTLGPAPLPPNVTVAYDLPLTDLLERVARSMFVVLPLEVREISTGQTVLLEAMSMGKAVIATRVSGTAEYIDDMRTGMLVPPNDPEALRAAVLRLASDAELRRRLGGAALERIRQHHLPQRYAERVAAVLNGTGSR